MRKSQVQAKFNQALALHQRGRLVDAERIYSEVLRQQPDHFDALHLLGVIATQTRRTERGIELITKAIGLNAGVGAAHNNLGNALQDLKRSEEALTSYAKAIALKPDYAEAYNNRGVALQDLKRSEEALASHDKAIALKPDYAEAYNNRGNALGDLKRSEEALANYDKAIALKPDYAEAYSNRGNALRELKRFEEALASYDKAIALKPDYAEAYNNRGNALQELKRAEEALASYDKAIALKPDYAEAYFNRGNALQDLKRPEEALASCDKAIALKPDYAEAHNNRGNALQDLNRSEEAPASYDKAIALKPDYAEAYNNRGNALGNLKRSEEALASYERALAAKPDHPYALGGAADCVMKLCDWEKWTRFAADFNAHVSGKKSIVYAFVLLGYSGDPAMQLQCARNYIEDMFPLLPPPFWSGQTWHHDKLRVAYLSADFRSHPVAYLTTGLFEQHDRSQFEIIGVSFSDDRGEMRKRLVAAFDEFHDIRRMSDKEVAKLLFDRQVDIAVDLMGYTLDSRPGIFARRPAPIQVSYLGFPATMGTQFIDYIIADKIVAPFEHQQFYTEKIVHLPDCFQVNDSKRKIAENAPTRQKMGLPEHAFVFCCFNAVWKITPAIFDIWMQLLHQVEGSVLWLIWDNESAERNLRKEAQQRGIDPSRLVFAGRLPFDEYLARDCLADLFLDTLPYNAGTTASDALWVGLPVLTCEGKAFASRMAASLLHAVGVPELIACNLEEYKALAVKLARNRALLAEIKAKLIRNRNTYPLFNTVRFARHIEAAYRTMWDTWQHGEVPKSFEVEPIDLRRSVGVARA
jgi:protein O-GlcNAc transferase